MQAEQPQRKKSKQTDELNDHLYNRRSLEEFAEEIRKIEFRETINEANDLIEERMMLQARQGSLPL